MPIDFYYLALSPYCRSVQMAAAALGVELNLIVTNTMTGDQFKPEYVKMNPQHVIPTIKDGDFILWESRAILGYLVNAYGKDDKYYPKDPKKRALVDQRLYFDIGTFYPKFGEYFVPQFKQGLPANPEKLKEIGTVFGLLDTFLENSRYAAGDEITIADFALMASASTFIDACNVSLKKFPNVKRWYEDCKVNVPGYQDTVPGLLELKKLAEPFALKDGYDD